MELLDAKPQVQVILSELINRPGRPGVGWEGATGSGMNWRLARSELEAERRYLRLDGEPVILYSLLSPPGGARANLLNDLYRLDATITVALEWRPWGLDSARRKIRGAQRHYFSKRYSMMAHMQETEGTSSAMVDSARRCGIQPLGQCTGRAGDGRNRLRRSGAHHLAARGPGADRTAGRRYPPHLCQSRRQGDPAKGTASWQPGSAAYRHSRGKRQVRSVFVSAGAVACMAPIFGPPSGSPRSAHLRRDALAILETQWRTPYYYDLFHGDVGHTLILGATGAGKSFTLNFLLVQALQYDPRVLILDLGGSYRWLTRFLGGGYLELSPDNPDGERRLPVTAFLAAGRRADLPVFDGLDHAPAPHRRLAGERGKTPAKSAPASKTCTRSDRIAAPWGCWSRACPPGCGPHWGAGTARALGENTSTTRRARKTSSLPTGR